MKILRLAIAAVFSSLLSFGAMGEIITKSGEASPPSGAIVPGTTGDVCATVGAFNYSDGTTLQCTVDLRFSRGSGADVVYNGPTASNPGGFFSYGAVNRLGFQNFLGFTSTSDLTSPAGAMATASGYFVATNDYSGVATPKPAAYGVYSEGRATTYNQFTTGHETDCQNTSSGHAVSTPDPNTIFGVGSGVLCYGQWISPGGSAVGHDTYDASAAIGVYGVPGAVNSGAQWQKGLVFGSTAIRSIGGHMEAINFATSQEIAWYPSSGAIATWRMFSEQTGAGAHTFEMSSQGIGIDAAGLIGGSGVATAITINSNTDTAFTAYSNSVLAVDLVAGTTYSALAEHRASTDLYIAAGLNGRVRVTTALALTNIPSSAGSGGLYLCRDNAGLVYTKTSCP